MGCFSKALYWVDGNACRESLAREFDMYEIQRTSFRQQIRYGKYATLGAYPPLVLCCVKLDSDHEFPKTAVKGLAKLIISLFATPGNIDAILITEIGR